MENQKDKKMESDMENYQVIEGLGFRINGEWDGKEDGT